MLSTTQKQKTSQTMKAIIDIPNLVIDAANDMIKDDSFTDVEMLQLHEAATRVKQSQEPLSVSPYIFGRKKGQDILVLLAAMLITQESQEHAI